MSDSQVVQKNETFYGKSLCVPSPFLLTKGSTRIELLVHPTGIFILPASRLCDMCTMLYTVEVDSLERPHNLSDYFLLSYSLNTT